mmetsp:Transcript_8306/g.23156  ORF Transcript_8306/g.23156 Transcript_8306/m.23156 type:complete len:324 (+) Transcript_8306:1307-2278(+)
MRTKIRPLVRLLPQSSAPLPPRRPPGTMSSPRLKKISSSSRVPSSSSCSGPCRPRRWTYPALAPGGSSARPQHCTIPAIWAAIWTGPARRRPRPGPAAVPRLLPAARSARGSCCRMFWERTRRASRVAGARGTPRDVARRRKRRPSVQPSGRKRSNRKGRSPSPRQRRRARAICRRTRRRVRTVSCATTMTALRFVSSAPVVSASPRVTPRKLFFATVAMPSITHTASTLLFRRCPRMMTTGTVLLVPMSSCARPLPLSEGRRPRLRPHRPRALPKRPLRSLRASNSRHPRDLDERGPGSRSPRPRRPKGLGSLPLWRTTLRS